MWRTAKAELCSLLHWVECGQQRTTTATSSPTADWRTLRVSSERRLNGKWQWAGLRTCWSSLWLSHLRRKSLDLEAFHDTEKQLENNHVALLWVSVLKSLDVVNESGLFSILDLNEGQHSQNTQDAACVSLGWCCIVRYCPREVSAWVCTNCAPVDMNQIKANMCLWILA